MTQHKERKERLLHHVTITVFCKPHDDPAAVLHGLDAVSPLPTAELLQLDEERDHDRHGLIHHRGKDIDLMTEKVETDDGPMTIYTLFFRRMQWTNQFAHALLDAMTPQELAEYRDDPTTLLDYDGHLSVRLDKTLLQTGRIVLTDDGNCYQVRAAVAAYPRTAVMSALSRLIAGADHRPAAR